MTQNNTLIYLLRRDLRLEDNPVFDKLSRDGEAQGFTHVLPLYVFAAQQIEVSGFLSKDASSQSPYPEARSPVGNFWRCGPHRAKFLAESVWDLKTKLQKIGSDLDIKVGMVPEVIEHLVKTLSQDGNKVGAVWMTSEEGDEEKREERGVAQICKKHGAGFKLFNDEKYFIDDRDAPLKSPSALPDVFTTYRKMVEPLRKAPRPVLAAPRELPPLPLSIPLQHAPFAIPNSLEGLLDALLKPLDLKTLLKNPPKRPSNTASAHPFIGGATSGLERIHHLMSNGSMSSYKATRNGMLGTDFSTKLSAWLALGSVTSRQIHFSLLDFEDGRLKGKPSTPQYQSWQDVPGYGKGENEGTKAVRFELLWRDYMRLCTRKFGSKLFKVSGFREDKSMTWRYKDQDQEATNILDRFLNGTTGTGLIDASQREMFLTGYTSNRARQNVASFLAKQLGMDWRLGAEWYESMLVDYDVSSNWGNWQYVAGVGNDPRGEARVFNPVKQAWDYDAKGEYVMAWIGEFKEANERAKDGKVMAVNEIFQAWETPAEKKRALGLDQLEWVQHPLKQIRFQVGRNSNRGGAKNRGGGPGRGGYGGSRYGSGGGGGHNGQGYGGQGSSRGRGISNSERGGGGGRRGGQPDNSNAKEAATYPDQP